MYLYPGIHCTGLQGLIRNGLMSWQPPPLTSVTTPEPLESFPWEQMSKLLA